jgi:hypothetical protein
MAHSDVFAGMLLAAGFKPGVDYYKSYGGMFLNGDAVNYLIENLQPEAIEDLEQNLEEKPFRIEDLPRI